jgi:hypothetical protein
MKASEWLKRAIEIVAALFAAFGGYLANLGPPQNLKAGLGGATAAGLASFAALIVLVVLASLPESVWRGRRRLVWTVAGIATGIAFLVAALRYTDRHRDLTFVFPPEGSESATLYVRGTVLTPAGDAYRQQHPDRNDGSIVADFGGISELTRVWTRESILLAERELTRQYLLLVVLLAVTLFALIEVIAANRER